MSRACLIKEQIQMDNEVCNGSECGVRWKRKSNIESESDSDLDRKTNIGACLRFE